MPSASAPMPGPPPVRGPGRAGDARPGLARAGRRVRPGGPAPTAIVWPRDASFVAVALAPDRPARRRGARPAPAGRVPRLLARRRVRGALRPGVRRGARRPVAPARRVRLGDVGGRRVVRGHRATTWPSTRSCRWCRLPGRCLRVRPPGTGLPGPWSDYWEVRETEPTLGTVAALRLGVREVASVLPGAVADRARRLGRRLDRGLRAFAPEYARYPGGGARDTAVTFLMPPFAPPDPEVRASWAEAAVGMLRPAGGLAPGEGWRRDGVSWTPTTALFASPRRPPATATRPRPGSTGSTSTAPRRGRCRRRCRPTAPRETRRRWPGPARWCC